MRYEESDVEFEDEVDLLMSSDIVSAQVSTKPISFTTVQSGWFFREDRQELVGTYNANFYSINGMSLETRKRREHLSNDDLMKNKALLENFAKGNAQYLEEQHQIQNAELQRKKTLEPPPNRQEMHKEHSQGTLAKHTSEGTLAKHTRKAHSRRQSVKALAKQNGSC